MAETFFTIYTGTAGRIDIGYDYTQDVANNTTSLTVKAYLVKTNGAYTSWNNFHNTFSLTVNGTATSLAYDFDFRNMTTGVRYLITTAVRSLTHNADGSIGGIPVSVYYVSSTSGLGTVSGSGSISIATIPRSSQPSLNTSSQVVGGSIIVYTNRASSAFTHYIYLAFGSGTFLIGDGVGASVTWTLPASLANQIPNSSSGYGTIYVDTYNGATYIGTKSTGLTVTIPDNASYRPVISSLNAYISGAGRDATIGSFIQGISKVYVAFSRSANGGASIVSDSINIRRQSDSGNNQTLSGNAGTSGTLSLDGTYLITSTTTDSRGRSTSSSITITVQPYVAPRIVSFTASRNSSNKTIVNTSRNGTYSSLGGSNPLTVQIQRKLVTEANYTTLNTTDGATNTFAGNYDSTGNSETSSYNFRLVISDSFGNSASAVITISTSATSLSIKRDIGIGVGKIWERGALDVRGESYLDGSLRTSGEATFDTSSVFNGPLHFAQTLNSGGKRIGVLQWGSTGTPTHIKIHTKIPFSNSIGMPLISITGYAYGNANPIDLKIVFYIYNGAFVNSSVISNSNFRPSVYLTNEGGFVCITLQSVSIYYPSLTVDVFDYRNLPSSYFTGWTISDTSYSTGSAALWLGYADEANKVVGYGYNSNGMYIKFGNGTLICWFEGIHNNSTDTPTGSVWKSGTLNFWTFPHAFATTPSVNITAGFDSSAVIWTSTTQISNSGVGYWYVSSGNYGATNFRVSRVAVGRWI